MPNGHRKLLAVLEDLQVRVPDPSLPLLTSVPESRISTDFGSDPDEFPQQTSQTPSTSPDMGTGQEAHGLTSARMPLLGPRADKWREADKRLENPSRAEMALWAHLRNRQLDGFFFLREYSIMAWWADFYCAAGRLVVEVDGASHDDRWMEDAERDTAMENAGYKVLRFPARRVFSNVEAVLARIRSALDTPKAKAHRDQALKSAGKAYPIKQDPSGNTQ